MRGRTKYLREMNHNEAGELTAVVNCNGDEGASATAQGTHQIAVVAEGDPRIALPANAWNCV